LVDTHPHEEVRWQLPIMNAPEKYLGHLLPRMDARVGVFRPIVDECPRSLREVNER